MYIRIYNGTYIGMVIHTCVATYYCTAGSTAIQRYIWLTYWVNSFATTQKPSNDVGTYQRHLMAFEIIMVSTKCIIFFHSRAAYVAAIK
jgi:hypothetical protein